MKPSSKPDEKLSRPITDKRPTIMMILGFFISVFISAFVLPFNPLDILVCFQPKFYWKAFVVWTASDSLFSVRITPRGPSSSSSSSYYSLRFLLTQKVCIMDSQIHTPAEVSVGNGGPFHNAFHIRSTHWIERWAIKEKVSDDFVKISAFQPHPRLVLINLWDLCLHRLPIYGEIQIHFRHRTLLDPSWKIPLATLSTTGEDFSFLQNQAFIRAWWICCMIRTIFRRIKA